MNRRAFLAGLGAACGVSPAARAQRSRPLLALLLTAGETSGANDAWPVPLRRALAELGWVEGRTIDIASRFADGRFERLPALAAELVALRPDVLLTHALGARAAAGATGTIPVVVGAAAEETLMALTGGLARPSGNVTGLVINSAEQHAKCVELFSQIRPGPARIGVLINPENRGREALMASLASAFGASGLAFVRVEGAANLPGGLRDALSAERLDALLVTGDPAFNRQDIDRAIDEAAKSLGIAHFGTFEAGTRAGALFSLGADYQRLIRRSAAYVDRILKGATPAELPVERPSVFRLVVNLASAQALRLTIPPAILARADEVIE